MKAKFQSLLQSHYSQTIQAMGDNSLTEDGSPDVSRTYSSTKHVMIRIPQKESPPKNKENISLLQEPFVSSQTRSLDDPNIDSIVNKYYVKSSKLEKNQNPHYTSVDSLINEKTRSILTNLDNKLSKLQESTPVILPLSPIKPQSKKQIPVENIGLTNFSGQKSTKTDEDLLNNFPDFTSMFKNAIQSTENHMPMLNDKQSSEVSVSNSKSNSNCESSNSMQLSNNGDERKKMLDHYVRRVLSQQPSDSLASNNESTIPSSLKSSLKSSTSLSSSNSVTDSNLTLALNKVSIDVCDSMKPKVRFVENTLSSSKSSLLKSADSHVVTNENLYKPASAKLLGIYQQSDSPTSMNQKSPLSTQKSHESLLEYLNTSPPIN